MCSSDLTGTASYANERMVYDDFLKSYISEDDCRRIIKAADISFIKDKKDPGPQRKLAFDLCLLRLRRGWLRLKALFVKNV